MKNSTVLEALNNSVEGRKIIYGRINEFVSNSRGCRYVNRNGMQCSASNKTCDTAHCPLGVSIIPANSNEVKLATLAKEINLLKHLLETSGIVFTAFREQCLLLDKSRLTCKATKNSWCTQIVCRAVLRAVANRLTV